MKDKIVGSLLILFFLCATLCAKVELRIMDMNGNPLKQAAVGEPCMLEVNASDTDSVRTPHIDGLEAFNVHNAGVQMRSINGNSSVKHSYKLRCDKTGEYVIGPAVITINDEKIASDCARITVGQEQLTQEMRSKKKEKSSSSSPLLVLKCDKKEVFVGQKITLHLSFLYTDDALRLEQLMEPELKDFTVGSKSGPFKDSKTSSGVAYNVLTWCFEMYAQHPGEHLIPACYADYLLQQKRDRFSGFPFFLGNHSTRKRIYSKAACVNVLPLPPHDPPAEAIGVFESFTGKIDPSIAKEGEGMVLSLCIEGEGNLEALSIPVLKNMPAACKYYDSKAFLLDKAERGKTGKCFEYIVQALEGGDCEIPSQEFIYFDTKRHAYKTLKTAPLRVTIIGQHAPKEKKNLPTKPDEIKSDQDKLSQDTNDQEDGSLSPLNKTGAWYASDPRFFSWSWFFIIMFLACGHLGFSMLRFLHVCFHRYYELSFRKTGAFSVARKRLKNAKGDVMLYHLFIELFAARLGLPSSSISEHIIETTLNQAGLDSDQLGAWNRYFTILAEQVYSGDEMRDKTKELFKEARDWIDILEVRL